MPARVWGIIAGETVRALGTDRRSVLLLLCASFLYVVPFGAIYTLLTLYMDRVSGSYTMVGLVVSVPLVIEVVMSFVWGWISDWMGRRKGLILASTIVGGLMFFPMPYLDPVPLLVLRSVQTCFLSSMVLLTAMLTELVPDSQGGIMGLHNLSGGLGWAVGGVVPGLVLGARVAKGSFGVTGTLFACGLMSLVSAFLVHLAREPAPIPGVPLHRLFVLENRSRVIHLAATMFVLMVGYYVVIAMFPSFCVHGLGLPDRAVGILVAVSGFTTVVASPLAGAAVEHLGRRSVLVGSLLGYVGVMTVYALVDDPGIVALVWAIPLWPFLIVAATALIGDLTRRDERGRGMAIENASHKLGSGVGSMVSGPMVNAIGFQRAFLAGGVLAAAAAAIGVTLRPPPLSPRAKGDRGRMRTEG